MECEEFHFTGLFHKKGIVGLLYRQSARYQHQHATGGSLSSCLEKVIMTFFLGAVTVVLVAAGMSSGSPSAASLEGCQVSESYPMKVRRWCSLITFYAKEASLPPDLVAAVIWQESGGNPKAYSHSGAVGLMQVMPRDGKAAEFRCNGQPCFDDRPSMLELRDPEFNIRYGTQLLGSLVNKYNGNYRQALRAYGPMDVGFYYADIVLRLYGQYGALQAN